MKALRFLPLFALAFFLSAGLGAPSVHADGEACSSTQACASSNESCNYSLGTCYSFDATCASICSSGTSCVAGNCTTNPSTLPGTTGNTGGITNTTNTSGGGINTTQLQGYEQSIVTVINSILVPLLVAVAFIVFLWGVFNYFIRGAAEPEKRKEGAQFVLWGIIGFVIIFSVWGLVNLLLGTLSLTAGGGHQAYPTL